MTAPVQEPSQGRTDQAQEWKTRQLFRRPAPPAAEAGADFGNGVIKHSLFGQEWEVFDQNGKSGGGWGGWVADAASPFGGYYGGQTTQDAYFVVGAILGPAGSRWAFDVGYERGSDYGTLEIDWQTQPLTDTSYATPQEQAIVSVDTGASFYTASGSGVVNTVDCYSAGSGYTFAYSRSLMTPKGTAGQMLSANGTADADYTNTSNMQGGGDGSVFWWARMRVHSKNASSSNYRMRINFLRLRRQDTGGYTPW